MANTNDGPKPKLVTKVPKGYTPKYVDPELGQVHGMDVALPPADANNAKLAANPDAYFESMKQKVASGVDPNHLAEQGYISKDYISKLQPFYQQKLVYTQQPTIAPVAEFTPATSNISSFKKEPIDYVGAPYDTFTAPNLNGQTNQSIQHRVDRATGQIVDMNNYLKTKDYKGSLTNKTLDDLRNESYRGTGNQTMSPNNKNSKTIVDKTPVNNSQTTNINAGQGFKKGGPVKSALASKIKGYDDGGVVPDINSGTQVNAPRSLYDTQSNDFQANGGSSSALADSITNKGNDTYSNKFNISGKNMPEPKYQTTPGTQEQQNQQQTANSTNSSVDSALSQTFGWYGLAKTGEGLGKSALKYDANGNPVGSDKLSTGYNRSLNTAFTPAHEQAIDDFSKGNTVYGIADIASGGMAKTSASMVGTALGNNNWLGKVSNQYADSTNNPTKSTVTKLNPKTGLYETVGTQYNAPEKGFAKGGLVEGIGGPKSDSISAKVKGDSFVVPAENVGLAKQIKLHILGKNPEEKAELKQSGGENVKLSNTEMLFTPEERYELLRKGVDLNALAPNAANTLKNHLKGGGSVKSYMQMCADGGPIDDLNPFAVHPRKYPKNGDDLKDKISKAKADEDAKIAAQTTNSPFRNAKIPSYNQINNPEKNYGLPFYDKLINSPATSKNTTPTKKSALASKIATPKYTTEPIEIKPYSNLATSTSPTYTGNPYVSTNSTALINNGNPNTNTAQKGNGNGFDYGSAIGLGQSALGLGLLLDKNNKRPVDSLAPAFQSQLAASIAQSKYGYTPEQKSLLNEQQIEGRNNALGAVYNAAGGNGAVALNSARQVFNDSYKSKLATASDDEMLRLQKMNQANGMSQQDQEYRRRLFDDNMNKFQQNQAAYSNLVGAGLDNFLGSQRYGQQKQAQREIDKINAI